MKNYEEISIIGEGAYGVVLKARHRHTNKIVAIKKFKETDEQELILKTSLRQINVLRAIKHENIVILQQTFKSKGIYYLVFEYVDRNLLEQLEQSGGVLPSRLIAKYMYQLFKGLSYMHENHYIHRDIKPENLLISSDHKLKICDMGFARKMAGEKQPMTDYVATRWYRSPELLVGAPYDSSVDIWAAGCIMAELIDGRPLFPGKNQIDQLSLIKKCFGQLEIEDKLNCKLSVSKKKKVNQLKLKYKQLISSPGIDLLEKMLHVEPKKRITAKQALRHPFFEPYNLEERSFQLVALETQRFSSVKMEPIFKKRRTVKLPQPFRTQYSKQKDFSNRSQKFDKFQNTIMFKNRKKTDEKETLLDFNNSRRSRLFIKASINHHELKKTEPNSNSEKESDLVFFSHRFFNKYSKA